MQSLFYEMDNIILVYSVFCQKFLDIESITTVYDEMEGRLLV